MNTTTNYGLKQYEGTDLFNPLTVENVNMGDIDTSLKAVSDHAVGAATELTTGTVHALTRSDTDRDVFAFVATSNYESGDTFTLDGTQVSALTPDGQTLATGSYVIGSMVLCALHDTLITVYVNPAKAKDSDKLDGHDSSYFATDEDLDTVAGTIGAISDKVGSAVLTTTAPDLSGAVNELNTHLTARYVGAMSVNSPTLDISQASGLVFATYMFNQSAVATTFLSKAGSFPTVLEFIESNNNRLAVRITVSDGIATATFPSSQGTQSITVHYIGN